MKTYRIYAVIPVCFTVQAKSKKYAIQKATQASYSLTAPIPVEEEHIQRIELAEEGKKDLLIPRAFVEEGGLTQATGVTKTYTMPEKSWLLQAGRGMWIGSEFMDHRKMMRIVSIGTAYRPVGEKSKLIDIVAVEKGTNDERS